MQTDIRHWHEALQATLPQGTPLTLLHIGEAQTEVAAGDGSNPAAVLLLAIGSKKTATDFFHHTPPTPGEMETAIMVVEDEVTRARPITAGHPRLYTHDAAIRELALLAGVQRGHPRHPYVCSDAFNSARVHAPLAIRVDQLQGASRSRRYARNATKTIATDAQYMRTTTLKGLQLLRRLRTITRSAG